MLRLMPVCLTLLLTALLAVGCSVSDSNEPVDNPFITDLSNFSQDSTLLVDAWRWRRTVCCFGNLRVETPESTGDKETLIVTEDDSVRVVRNDQLEEETTLDDYLDRAQWGVRGDSLVVSWAYLDGPQRIYVRDLCPC